MRQDKYEVALYGDNLTDERGPTAANGPTLLAGPYPRTVGLKLTFHLD
jgi:outer membrane receptor protein involved in Fe transport